MKKIAVMMFLFVTVNAFSQDSTSNQRNIERIAAMQHKQVVQRITDINEEQQQQLKFIFDEFGKELSVLKNKQGREKLQYFQTINSQKDKKVLKVLTAGQRKIYEDLMQEWKEKIQQRRKGRK